MKTRKEQFDSAVRNSLDQVSKDVEYAETMRWLVEDISDAERKALTENNTSLGQNNVVRGTQRFQVKSRDGKIISDFEMRVMKIKPLNFLKRWYVDETRFLKLQFDVGSYQESLYVSAGTVG